MSTMIQAVVAGSECSQIAGWPDVCSSTRSRAGCRSDTRRTPSRQALRISSTTSSAECGIILPQLPASSIGAVSRVVFGGSDGMVASVWPFPAPAAPPAIRLAAADATRLRRVGLKDINAM